MTRERLFLLVPFVMVGCEARPMPLVEYDPVVTDPGGTGIESVPEAPEPACDPDDIAPYDPGSLIAYTLDVSDSVLALLEAMGYSWSWGETYDQLETYAESVTIDAPECDEIVFDSPRVATGRQMGYESPYGGASWIVEYNEVNQEQTVGGYDDGRYWNPKYDGPVAVVWLYEYSMDYVGIPHRYAVWMKMLTTWWGGQSAIYNALEPYEDDFLKRMGFTALWEGYDLAYHPGEGADCKAGDCSAAAERADTCFERLYALSDPSELILETGDCFDWDELASVLAWHDWFGHWDGCGSNNCYGYATGDEADPSTWQIGLLVSGVDLLLNPWWTPVEYVELRWYGGTVGTFCRADTSEGGCQDRYVSKLNALNEAARSGQMEKDLRDLFGLRESLGAAKDGDENWVEQAVDWVTERPDYVDAAVDLMLFPCGHDTADSGTSPAPPPGGGGYGWDSADPCANASDSGPNDSY